MSEELQRTIGALLAKVENLTTRVGRIENFILMLLLAGAGLVVTIVLRSVGFEL